MNFRRRGKPRPRNGARLSGPVAPGQGSWGGYRRNSQVLLLSLASPNEVRAGSPMIRTQPLPIRGSLAPFCTSFATGITLADSAKKHCKNFPKEHCSTFIRRASMPKSHGNFLTQPVSFRRVKVLVSTKTAANYLAGRNLRI